MLRSLLLAPAGVLAVVGLLGAQGMEPHNIPRLSGPIRMDGRSDEVEWQAIEPLPMVLHQPTFEGTPSERTEVRIAHDDHYLYVAGRMYDSEPSAMQVTSLKRDHLTATEDWLCLNLDTFNDKENLLSFCTTPGGIRSDLAIFNDAQGVLPMNPSWNTFWDVAVVRSEEGWFAEMRIPFSSLRFQDQRGRVTMGLITWRYIPRKRETVIFPAIPPKWGFWSMWKPSQAQVVTLEGIERRNPLYVAPYVLAGYDQSAALNGAETAYDLNGTPTREAGMDVKYGLTSNLTLDVSVNTDFAQVEADDQQVNLTRFSLFFPEKRVFFQERSSVFDFITEGSDRLFYSRRIGLTSAGEPTRIYGGARMIGRVGEWDVGMLNMQAAGEGGLGSENMGVVRLRRQVLNPNSYVGGIFTSRVGVGGSYNRGYGVDGLFRLFDQDYLGLKLAQTADHERGSGWGASLASAMWQRRTQDGLGYTMDLTRVGDGYHPALGFIRRTDYTRLGSLVSYGWRPGESSPILTHTLALEGMGYLRNRDRSTESVQGVVRWTLETKRGRSVEVATLLDYDDLEQEFTLDRSSGVSVLPGSYTFTGISARYGTPAGGLRRATWRAEGGSFYDGWRVAAGVEPTWSLGEHLSLGGAYQFNRVAFPDRGQAFNAHIGRVRTEAMLNTKLSATAFLQFSSTTDAVGVNVRMRYNPREGNDVYVVYNEGLNVDRERLSPALPLRSSRTLLVKYSHTFPLSLFD